jgi:hypothetical protein
LPEALALAGKTDTSDVRPEFLKSWATPPGSVFPVGTRLTAFALSLGAVLLPVAFFVRWNIAHLLGIDAATLESS